MDKTHALSLSLSLSLSVKATRFPLSLKHSSLSLICPLGELTRTVYMSLVYALTILITYIDRISLPLSQYRLRR